MSVHALPTVDPTVPLRCPGFITALIVRVGQGDEAALGRLFDVVLPLVLATVGRTSTTQAGSDARVAEAFVRIWRHAPTFDPGSHGAAAWIADHATATAPAPTRPRVARRTGLVCLSPS